MNEQNKPCYRVQKKWPEKEIGYKLKNIHKSSIDYYYFYFLTILSISTARITPAMTNKTAIPSAIHIVLSLAAINPSSIGGIHILLLVNVLISYCSL